MPNEDGGPGGDRRDETTQRQKRERLGGEPPDVRKPVVLEFRSHRSVSSGSGGPTLQGRGYESLKIRVFRMPWSLGELRDIACVVLLCASLGLIILGPWIIAIHFAFKFW